MLPRPRRARALVFTAVDGTEECGSYTPQPHALEIAGIDVKMLPAGWHETRDESLRALADDWIRGGKSVALLVPSAAIRGEWNILVNPMHSDFSMIIFRDPTPFEFDMRMFR
jgi:RES domain-containing protein